MLEELLNDILQTIFVYDIIVVVVELVEIRLDLDVVTVESEVLIVLVDREVLIVIVVSRDSGRDHTGGYTLLVVLLQGMSRYFQIYFNFFEECCSESLFPLFSPSSFFFFPSFCFLPSFFGKEKMEKKNGRRGKKKNRHLPKSLLCTSTLCVSWSSEHCLRRTPSPSLVFFLMSIQMYPSYPRRDPF